MIYINNQSTDPFYNHALEEYFLKDKSNEYLLLWRNRPSILIGRNQNIYAECNLSYVQENKIEVVRRLSGGGAVYTDLGNINFTFIRTRMYRSGRFTDGFEEFANPVIKALNFLGVEAVFSGRNDILVDGMKISGNAQFAYKDRILHHGTLLFSGDLEALSQALIVAPEKYKGKAVSSVRSRVTNISEYLEEKIEVTEFLSCLKRHLMSHLQINEEYTPEQSDIDQIEKRLQDRFIKNEWNFGNTAIDGQKKSKKFPSGLIDVYVVKKSDRIEHISFYGDFFGEKPVSELEQMLQYVTFQKEAIEEVLKQGKLDRYMSGINPVELAKLIVE